MKPAVCVPRTACALLHTAIAVGTPESVTEIVFAWPAMIVKAIVCPLESSLPVAVPCMASYPSYVASVMS